MISRIFLWILEVYRRWISPLKPPCCRYLPTCSSYAKTALIYRALGVAILLIAARLLRCNGLFAGGFDYVALSPRQLRILRARCMLRVPKIGRLRVFFIPQERKICIVPIRFAASKLPQNREQINA